MARPPPRKTSTDGGETTRGFIPISLKMNPPGIYAEVAIGDPPSKQSLHIDTGLGLTWVLVNDDYYGYGSYDPTISASFRYLSCEKAPNDRSFSESSIKGQCNYHQRMADNTLYYGTLGLETFTFHKREEGGRGIFENVLFGFGSSEGRQLGDGSLGLDSSDISLVKSYKGKFSICLGNFNEIRPSKHFLALGDSAVFGGSKIPLNLHKNRAYSVPLTSIIVSKESLNVEAVLSNTVSILDSGSSVISLIKPVYEVFIKRMTKIMSDAGYLGSPSGGLQCYDGKIPQRLNVQLALVFGKVVVTLKASTVFIQVEEDSFCLFVNESPIRENLLGLPLFQDNNIGFDIQGGKLHIKSIECKSLYDDYKDELDNNV